MRDAHRLNQVCQCAKISTCFTHGRAVDEGLFASHVPKSSLWLSYLGIDGVAGAGRPALCTACLHVSCTAFLVQQGHYCNA